MGSSNLPVSPQDTRTTGHSAAGPAVTDGIPTLAMEGKPCSVCGHKLTFQPCQLLRKVRWQAQSAEGSECLTCSSMFFGNSIQVYFPWIVFSI